MKTGRWTLARICFAAGMLTASSAFCQTPAAPGAEPLAPVAVPGGAGVKAEADYCNDPVNVAAGGAHIVSATGPGLQPKSWQAEGGEIQFTVSSSTPIPPDAPVYVCFGWKGAKTGKLKQQFQSHFELSDAGKTLKVTTIVPKELADPPSDVDRLLPLVPLADVRIVAAKNKSVVVDASTTIGITSPIWAFIFAVIAVVLGLLVLYVAATYRVQHPGINSANWFLRIISTPTGYASLSQLQILIWTFVVAASAVYVMSLSGRLIEITQGTLILLGIAGAAGLGAKVHSEAQAANIANAAQQATAQSLPTAPALMAQAAAMKTAPPGQIPKWSDLIINDGGTGTPEVDVTRFQMLFFTIVTAVFVLTSVIANYVIPEIPGGFVTLMGISNGVYIGSKVVQRS